MHRLFIFCSALLLSAVAVFGQSASLEVSVNYTGKGEVDQTHKLYVTLWDNPDFTNPGSNNARPLQTGFTASKSGTVTFKEVNKNPVYVGLLFDPTGKWDAASEPPVVSRAAGKYTSGAEQKGASCDVHFLPLGRG